MKKQRLFRQLIIYCFSRIWRSAISSFYNLCSLNKMNCKKTIKNNGFMLFKSVLNLQFSPDCILSITTNSIVRTRLSLSIKINKYSRQKKKE